MNIRRISAFLLACAPLLHAQPSWDDRLDFDDIAQQLQKEAIRKNNGLEDYFKKHKKNIDCGNRMRMITLDSGLKGVFKPGEYGYAEVAAYKASRAIGLRLVPPTVLRTIDGQTGSLQFYIETKTDFSAASKKYLQMLHPKVVSDMKVFYFVFGQWDIHKGNQVIHFRNGKPYLGLIDNAGMLHRMQVQYGKNPFIEKGEEHEDLPCIETPTFPFDRVEKVYTGSRKKMWDLFGKVIPGQLSHLVSRPHDVKYVFWKKTLWMEVGHTIGKIDRFYDSTIQALKKLNAATLREVWSEWLAKEPRHAEDLIALTLERRDQLVKIADRSGALY